MHQPCRLDFPLFQAHPDLAYLDNAATMQRPRQMIEAISTFYSEENANVHRGLYALSNKASDRYESMREKVAHFLDAHNARSIAFTKGTTDSINIVARAFTAPHLRDHHNIVSTFLEHHANFLPWQKICEEKAAEMRVVEVSENGEISLEDLERKLDANTKMLALNHISNAIGTISPVKEIISMAHRRNVPVMLDAAQSAAYYELNTEELQCDFLAFSGHKIFGPFGTGILYVHERHLGKMEAHHVGGGMIQHVSTDRSSYAPFPQNVEAGTPSIADVIGLGAAINYLDELDKKEIRTHLQHLTAYTINALNEMAGVSLVGNPQNRAGIVSFVIEGIHAHDVASFLDKDHIAVRAGTHCAQPLFTKLKVPASVRVSFAHYNTLQEVDRLCQSLKELITFWNND